MKVYHEFPMLSKWSTKGLPQLDLHLDLTENIFEINNYKKVLVIFIPQIAMIHSNGSCRKWE